MKIKIKSIVPVGRLCSMSPFISLTLRSLMEIRKIILCKQSPRTMRVASVEGSNAWPKQRKRCFLWTKMSKHEKSQTPLHYMNACVGARFAIKNVTRQNRENMNRWNQRKKLPSSERVLSVMYASRKDQKKTRCAWFRQSWPATSDVASSNTHWWSWIAKLLSYQV